MDFLAFSFSGTGLFLKATVKSSFSTSQKITAPVFLGPHYEPLLGSPSRDDGIWKCTEPGLEVECSSSCLSLCYFRTCFKTLELVFFFLSL